MDEQRRLTSLKTTAKLFINLAGKKFKNKVIFLPSNNNNENIDEEINKYRKNWIDDLGIEAEIWMMHNWGGKYQGPYNREKREKENGRYFIMLLRLED